MACAVCGGRGYGCPDKYFGFTFDEEPVAEECLCAGCGKPFTWRNAHPPHPYHPTCYHVQCFLARIDSG